MAETKPEKKDSFLMKTLGAFFTNNLENIGEYIWKEVVVPAGKDMISNAGKKALDLIIYGDASKTQTSSYNSNNGSKYKQAYQQQQASQQKHVNVPRGSVMVDTEQQGKDILKRLDNDLKRTNQPVNIPDLYDCYNAVTNKTDYVVSYTDAKWGWYDLRSAEVVYTRDGWMVKMPEPMYLC